MTNIQIDKIYINSNQIWVRINGHLDCLDLFSLSRLLKHIDEKEIKIISRVFHSHNDYVSFENNFLFTLNRLLDNTNHPLDINLYKTFSYPVWITKEIKCVKKDIKSFVDYDVEDENNMIIVATIKNIKGEKLKDD